MTIQGAPQHLRWVPDDQRRALPCSSVSCRTQVRRYPQGSADALRRKHCSRTRRRLHPEFARSCLTSAAVCMRQYGGQQVQPGAALSETISMVTPSDIPSKFNATGKSTRLQACSVPPFLQVNTQLHVSCDTQKENKKGA